MGRKGRRQRPNKYNAKAPRSAGGAGLRGPGGSGGMVVVNSGPQSAADLHSMLLDSNPNRQTVSGYSSQHNILSVGEGDFSWALALATTLGGDRIIASCLDSKKELFEKYPTALDNVTTLRALGATVLYGVDCRYLHDVPEIYRMRGRLHRIVFNFPHVGGATEEDVRVNQRLLRHFFASAGALVARGEAGEVHVALRSTPFYDSKRLFIAESFHGYKAQRTNPAVREPPTTEGAKIHRFGLKAKSGKRPRPSAARDEVGADEEAATGGAAGAGAGSGAGAGAAAHRGSKGQERDGSGAGGDVERVAKKRRRAAAERSRVSDGDAARLEETGDAVTTKTTSNKEQKKQKKKKKKESKKARRQRQLVRLEDMLGGTVVPPRRSGATSGSGANTSARSRAPIAAMGGDSDSDLGIDLDAMADAIISARRRA